MATITEDGKHVYEKKYISVKIVVDNDVWKKFRGLALLNGTNCPEFLGRCVEKYVDNYDHYLK